MPVKESTEQERKKLRKQVMVPSFFHTAVRRQKQVWLLAIGREKVLCVTNIGVFLKIATDCNFFFEK